MNINMILEQAPDGILVTDADGIVTVINQAACRLLEIERAQIVSFPLRKFVEISPDVYGDWVEYAERFVKQAAQGDKAALLVITERAKLDVRFAQAIEDGRIIGLIMTIRDVSYEYDLDLAKREFLLYGSHDLRAPLMVITGYNELLLRGADGNDNEKRLEWLRKMKSSTDHLVNVAEAMLLLSNLDSRRGKFWVDAITLKQVVSEVLELLQKRQRHQQKMLNIEIKIDPELPTFQADHSKLSRILDNIIDNAFSYTPDGGSVEIGGKITADNEHVLIWVSDTGIGIPESFRDEIWQRFKRYEENAIKMNVAGSGLGLSIVQELVERHGGKVWFESEVDKGTTFYVELPLAHA